nr:ABC-2 family transporter protein [Paenibacillus arenosi]
MVGQILGYAANYVIVWLLLNRFTSIEGWAWPEMAFLISINVLTYAIGASFTYSPMLNLEQLMIKGDLDKYLIKPIHPFAYLIASYFNFGYIAHILISAVLLIWSLGNLNVHWGVFEFTYFLFTLLSGSMLQAGGLILIGSWSLYFMKSQFMGDLYFKIKDVINYPISAYAGVIQVVLTWMMPLAFINYYPALYLLQKEENTSLLLVPMVGPLFLFLTIVVWHRGIRQYQGAGS